MQSERLTTRTILELRLRRGSSATATSVTTTAVKSLLAYQHTRYRPCRTKTPTASGVGKSSQLGSKLAGGTALLALTSLSSAVTALATTTLAIGAAAEAALAALALAEHTTGRSVRALLLDVGSRNDLSGQVKPFAEVVETLGGQGVVVVLPGELGLDVAARGQRLASLDDVQVLGVDFGVLGQVVVLSGDENALTEEVLLGEKRLEVSNTFLLVIGGRRIRSDDRISSSMG